MCLLGGVHQAQNLMKSGFYQGESPYTLETDTIKKIGKNTRIRSGTNYNRCI